MKNQRNSFYAYGKFVFVFLFAFNLACRDASDRRCFKRIGPETQVEIALDQSIDSLYLMDDIAYEFYVDITPRVIVKAGANIVNFINVKNDQQKLTIQNDNKCNFLRDFTKKPIVQIYLPKINYLFFSGSNSFSAMDTIKSGALRVFIRDGAGSVKLKVDASYFETTVTHGVGDFSVEGKAISCYFACNTNSFCDTRKLEVSHALRVLSNTGGDMLVNADGAKFFVTINRDGNVKYIGAYSDLELSRTGNGNLLHINE